VDNVLYASFFKDAHAKGLYMCGTDKMATRWLTVFMHL